MRRRSMSKNAPLGCKENESRCSEEKEEASFPHLQKDQKICKAIESKVVKASKKENLPDGNQAQKRSRRSSKRLEKESFHAREGFGGSRFPERCLETLKGDVVGEPPLPLDSKENAPRCGPVSWGDECCLTPDWDKAEGKSDGGIAEKPRKTPVDFATVTIGEFGITQESFTKPSAVSGKSPTSLKFRRRSNIGARGSPENNTLIRFIAQQRSNRQKAAFTEVSPFKHGNVRSLKDKIGAFQTSFKLSEEEEEEEEGETGFSGLSQVNDASQETGCSQNKAPFTKQRNLDQWSEEFMSDNSGADLKDNFRHSLTNSIKSDTTVCTILSSCQNVTLAEPAAAASKEWVFKQHSPIESLKAGQIGDVLESGHDCCFDDIVKDVRSNVSDLSRRKVSFVEEPSLEAFDDSKAPSTPLHTGSVSLNEHGQSGSRLASILKKTPVKQLTESAKKSSNDAVDGGGGESLTVSSCAETFETLQTEETERQSSEKPKKRRVTFGGALSPEIFDETLPANTPLCKGATPIRHPGLQSNDFDCSDERVEPLQELVEDSVAADDLSPVGNAEAETDRSDMITRSSTKRKKRRRGSYEKRRTKKVKKPLYGEREMASKKPLLTPIPEIPEVLYTSAERRVTRSMSVQLSLIF